MLPRIGSAYFSVHSFTCFSFSAESSFSQRIWQDARSCLSSVRDFCFSVRSFILWVVFSIASFILEKFNSPLWNVLLNVDKYANISFNLKFKFHVINFFQHSCNSCSCTCILLIFHQPQSMQWICVLLIHHLYSHI